MKILTASGRMCDYYCRNYCQESYCQESIVRVRVNVRVNLHTVNDSVFHMSRLLFP